MTRPRQIRVVKSGLVFLTLAFAPVASAQPATSPPEPPPAETPSPPAPSPEPPPPPAYAAPLNPPPPTPSYPLAYVQARAPGARNHDGFYLRMQMGGGYTSMSTSVNGTGRSIAGGSTAFDIALGGALNPHVIIYGTLISSTARDPDRTFSRPPVDTALPHGMVTGTVDIGGFGDTGVVGIGGGAAYYFDSNLFFAGSLLGSRLYVYDLNGNRAIRSDLGFTFEGLLGKEWWVSDNWGLGVCGRVLLGAMKDRPWTSEPVPTWKVAAIAVLFSATFN